MTRRPFILASASPRRKELFSLLGIPFDVVPSEVTEPTSIVEGDVHEFVRQLAYEKTASVSQRFEDAVVIGADTIVVKDGQLYPKPESVEEAKQYLQQLSGSTHSVITAVGIYVNDQIATFSVETKVTFRSLDDILIDAYVASGDPLDKAGGYGIQSAGALLVDRIEGDYYTVVGLPIAQLTQHLRQLGLISLQEGDPIIDY